MGSHTYESIGRPLKERVNIVYSRSKSYDGIEVTQKRPEDLLQELKERNFKEVAICGGSQIYSMFMKEGVVDRLYLTIEPILFGKGITLFNEPFRYHLKLESCTQATNGALLLEYSVDYAGAIKRE